MLQNSSHLFWWLPSRIDILATFFRNNWIMQNTTKIEKSNFRIKQQIILNWFWIIFFWGFCNYSSLYCSWLCSPVQLVCLKPVWLMSGCMSSQPCSLSTPNSTQFRCSPWQTHHIQLIEGLMIRWIRCSGLQYKCVLLGVLVDQGWETQYVLPTESQLDNKTKTVVWRPEDAVSPYCRFHL